jgi:endonuclease/exonuclease/phosphatase family metal-dependent hydrolase
MGVVGAAAGLTALTLALSGRWLDDPRAAGAGVLAGCAGDVALRASFGTWEPAWQRGAAAVIVGVVLAVALMTAALLATRSRDVPADHGGLRIGAGVAIGALLAIETLFLMSAGFVSSSAGASLPWGVAVTLIGLALALGALALSCRATHLTVVAVAAACALSAVAYQLPTASGSIVLGLTLVGQVAAGALLGAALTPTRASSRASGFGLGVGWLVFALTLALYQIHFDQPLPFDNRWIVGATAALSALAVVGARKGNAHRLPTEVSVLKVVAVSGAVALTAAVAVPSALALTEEIAPAPPSRAEVLRVVEWNVRQAVTIDGQLDPESFADALQQGGRPDVVVLSEVGRGWPVSGDLDLASWLSRRLHLRFTWGGAADGQFGNLVLSRLPIVHSRVLSLPVAGRSQGRSLVRAELDLGSGRRLTLLATHLQHQNNDESVAARRREVDVILKEWGGAPRTVLAGDLNPRQGDPPAYPQRQPGQFEEVRSLLDAGLTTAQDLTACTKPTSNRNCSDYILVTPDLAEETIAVGDIELSDHRPVVATIRVPP